MNDYLTATALTVVFLLSSLGAFFVFADVRHFNDVVAHCQKHGYLQDKERRINCSLEKR